MFLKILSVVSDNITYTTSAILIGAIVCLVLKILLEYFLKLHKLWYMTRKLPGPTGLPLLGNLLDVVGDTEVLLKQLVNWAECHPSPFRTWFGPKLHIILSDADSIKELLQNQKVIEKSELYGFAQDLIGNGLITAPVNEWRVHRKLVNTVFNSKALPPYGTFLAQKAQEIVKRMEVELHGKGFETCHYMEPCTLRMIFGILVGTSVDFTAAELNNFLKDFHRSLEIGFYRVPRLWLHPDIIFKRTLLGQEFKATVGRLLAAAEKAIQKADSTDARRHLPADKRDATAKGTNDGDNVSGLYMNLPRDRHDFTRQDLLHELITAILAGFHTLSTLMDFMTRMLAYYPNIQDKAYEELYSIYGSEDPHDRPVEIEDLPRMEYLECVIHETMRLFPPIGLIERGITKDVNIGSSVLPAGCTTLIIILRLHRNEKYWPNPLKFDPDRFLPEHVAQRHPGSYIPFSTGSRNCIAGKYAMMTAKILSATLLRRYILRVEKIVPIENIRLKTTTVLECVDPWKLYIEERNPGKAEAK